jgi:hypothetical protein
MPPEVKPMKPLVVIIIVAHWATAARAELPEGLQAYVDKIETYRAQGMKAYRENMRNNETDEATRRNARRKIAEIKNTHTLDYAEKFVAPSLSRDAKVGDVGQVDGARINKIIDETTMIVDATRDHIYQKRIITKVTSTYLVKGVSTEGLADGKPVNLPKTMIITGTDQERSKTYFVLEPLDIAKVRKEVDAYLKKRGKKPVMN